MHLTRRRSGRFNHGTMPQPRRPAPQRRAAHPQRPRRPAAWLEELRDLRTQITPAARRRKLALLAPGVAPVFRDPEQVVEYHDLLLFMRAYPDSLALWRETERRLRAFPDDVARYVAAARDASPDSLLDSGLVDSSVVHVFSFRLARALAALHPAAVEIDWDAYFHNDAANIPVALVPAMLWHESEAVDNDEAFSERSWLEMNRNRRDHTSLSALFRLFDSSGLPEAIQEHLYDTAEIPVRWNLTASPGSRTWKRVGRARPFVQTEPMRGRTRDLRARIAVPPPPLRLVSAAVGRGYVADVREVLASRVRELYPLSEASADEVSLYEPGRGLQLVIYGSQPAIRLPDESNMGAMFVRNGVPVGYGLAAIVFRQAEVAINIFATYRSGESAFLIEEFLRLCVHHFGARRLIVTSYQVGDDNDEGLDSGSFWFYYKLGFRPVRPAVAALALKEVARVESDPEYRTPRAMLKRLAKSDVFFDLDASRKEQGQGLALAELGYALTRHIARAYGGDRTVAVTESIRRLARVLPLGNLKRLTSGQQLGLRRLAPLIDAMGGVERWPRDDRTLLARLLRAKGGRRERDFVRLAQRLPRLEAGLRRLAAREARRRAHPTPGRRGTL